MEAKQKEYLGEALDNLGSALQSDDLKMTRWWIGNAIQTCCNSKVPWRHKAKCTLLTEEGNEKWKALDSYPNKPLTSKEKEV